jgi:ketosteroid isomerase-like protein
VTGFKFAPGLLLVLTILFIPAAPASAASASSDKDAIAALLERGRKAFDAHDVDAVMANYAPGDQLFVFDVIPPREYPSWEAYKKDWQELFEQFPGRIHNTISELSITVDGSTAYSHYIEAGTMTAKDGKTPKLTVRMTDVYRKIGGKWLIVLEHVSVPVDLATGKADLLSKP